MNPWRAAQQRLDAFAASLVGLTADDVMVLRTRAEFSEDWDLGHPIINLRLGLSDPPAGQEGWSVDAIYSLTLEIRRRSYDTGFEEFVHMRFTPAYTMPGDDGGQGGSGPRRADDRPPLP